MTNGARVKVPLALDPVEEATEVVDTVNQQTIALPLEKVTLGVGSNCNMLFPFEGGEE